MKIVPSSNSRLLRAAAAAVLAGITGACDAPTASEDGQAAPAGPSMLVNAACAGTGGQTHAYTNVTTAVTWTRANSPHRVTGSIYIQAGGRLTIAPGAIVCFEPETIISAENGGRLFARGLDTAQIVLTARDEARGWGGILLYGAPASPSYLTNIRIEHVAWGSTAVFSYQTHPAYVDSAVIRQSGRAVRFSAPGSRLTRSRVDSTTNRGWPAVTLGSGTRFETTAIRGAAGVGLSVVGENVLLLGGRIEGSGGTGLVVEPYLDLGTTGKAIRVTGGRSYGADMPAAVAALLYPTPALQDSLRGNARDTLLLGGGYLRRTLTLGPGLPARMVQGLFVDSAGAIVATPGASVAFGPSTGIVAQNGGRVYARGSAGNPVRFTADDPGAGWNGLLLMGTSAAASYLTNIRIEDTGVNGVAVTAYTPHRVILDSAVIRRVGAAVQMDAQGSRMSRTRVDTTLNAQRAAVQLGGSVRLESTLIRAAAGPGLRLESSLVQVVSCDIRDGDQDGILMPYVAVPVHNCNLVNNAGPGIRNLGSSAASVTGNWWGSTGGPAGIGGDGASGPLTVSPWRTTPYALPYVP